MLVDALRLSAAGDIVQGTVAFVLLAKGNRSSLGEPRHVAEAVKHLTAHASHQSIVTICQTVALHWAGKPGK